MTLRWYARWLPTYAANYIDFLNSVPKHDRHHLAILRFSVASEKNRCTFFCALFLDYFRHLARLIDLVPIVRASRGKSRADLLGEGGANGSLPKHLRRARRLHANRTSLMRMQRREPSGHSTQIEPTARNISHLSGRIGAARFSKRGVVQPSASRRRGYSWTCCSGSSAPARRNSVGHTSETDASSYAVDSCLTTTRCVAFDEKAAPRPGSMDGRNVGLSESLSNA